MKRVLIITYYWPPAGGSGVQRWVKFSKFLPSFGWQPVIYTPSNPQYTSIDRPLERKSPSRRRSSGIRSGSHTGFTAASWAVAVPLT